MPRRTVLLITVVAVLTAGAWFLLRRGDDGAPVRRRLQQFVDDVNRGATDNRSPDMRAAQFGSFFTDDIEIDLGRGAALIKGRDTLVAMTGRLQPRIAAFSLRFEDINVTVAPGGQSAEVHLTAEFMNRSAPNDRSLDAREFTIDMRRDGEEWRMRRVAAVETLK
jgi:hypothetical protein